jgi:hypothetical protein
LCGTCSSRTRGSIQMACGSWLRGWGDCTCQPPEALPGLPSRNRPPEATASQRMSSNSFSSPYTSCLTSRQMPRPLAR